MIDLTGRHAVVLGVASETSIAWGIAKTLAAAGARISLGYQMRFKSRVLQLVKSGEVPVDFCERCDVTIPAELVEFFTRLDQHAGAQSPDGKASIDALVHSIAWANPESFVPPVHELSVEDFTTALVTSAYSLLPLTRAALPRLHPGSSVIAMTYLGGQRVVTNYKVMGIAKAALEATVRELAADVGPRGVRVNAISAGPIRTLAAAAVAGFDKMLEAYAAVTPLRRTVTQEDVGRAASFLASDLSAGITGQVLFVDAGYSILGAASPGL